MSEPLELRLVQAVQTAIRAITVAGGYFYTVEADAVKLDPNASVEELMRPNGDRPFVLIEVQPDEWEYSPANQCKLITRLVLHWVSDSTPTDDTSRLQTYYRGCADLEKALAADISLGGLAVDVRITERSVDYQLNGAQVWAKVAVDIRSHRTVGVPA